MTALTYHLCPTLVIFKEDLSAVLLLKPRKPEAYAGSYSFIGGHMEDSDEFLLSGIIKRVKDSQIGQACRVKYYDALCSYSLHVSIHDQPIVSPHHFALHVGGPIELGGDFVEYLWSPVAASVKVGPRGDDCSSIVRSLLTVGSIPMDRNFIEV